MRVKSLLSVADNLIVNHRERTSLTCPTHEEEVLEIINSLYWSQIELYQQANLGSVGTHPRGFNDC